MNSKLGLGFMRHKDFNESQRIVDFAMSHNQNYFETCYFYLDYQCEEYVYNLLKKYNRQDYEICGKLPANSSNPYAIYDEQIKKVPNGYFDYYLIQAVSYNNIYNILKYDLINFLIKEKERGYIKNLGISIQCDNDCLIKLIDLYPWDIIQMPLNYFDWFISDEIKKNYNLIASKNIPVIAQAPLKQGTLIKQVNNLFLNKESLIDNAYCFLQNLSSIKYILCGTSNYNHYIDNYNAFQKKISFNINDYEKIIKDYKNNSFIQCINCLKCVEECPSHIPIPMFFQLYNKSLNNYTSFKDLQIIKETLHEPIQICLDKNCDCSFINGCPFNNNIKYLLANQIFNLKV